MVRLQRWQWVVLIAPIAMIGGFLLVAAGAEIHDWGINWVWGVVTVLLLGWRWLLVRWTRPLFAQVETVVAEVTEELETATDNTPSPTGTLAQQTETALQQVLDRARQDPPLWEDWASFWQRCQELVSAIAHTYHPEVKRPLLNIYVPQAYALIRGTIDDTDAAMKKLAPLLNQVSVGQVVGAVEVYHKLEPTLQKARKAMSWAQWMLNPVAAVAGRVTQKSSNQATQELFVNLSGLLKETALRNLSRQAISLYSGELPPIEALQTATPKTQTLQEILARAEPVETVQQTPLNLLLAGRTGAGKSSLINTLFVAPQAAVDVLPSTDTIREYHWQAETGDRLTLWDTPGYEQVNQANYRQQVLQRANQADGLLLVTPALDPALQMDVDFLQELQQQGLALPVWVVLSQVDKLRPLREWQPPYHWQTGTAPKEISIRAATEYRVQAFQGLCHCVLPMVLHDAATGRAAWGVETLAQSLVDGLPTAQQVRLARFLRSQTVRIAAAAKLIDDYTTGMTTAQGMTAFFKSPILQFLSVRVTGSTALGDLLAASLPVEQTPLMLGKLQLARELFSLLQPNGPDGAKPTREFDLRVVWAIAADHSGNPKRNAWAFGHAITEYCTQGLTVDQTRDRLQYYLTSSPPS
jgi:uncharacterized protein